MNRFLGAVLFVLLISGAAMAQITQPVTFTIFANGSHQPATYTTDTATIPTGAARLRMRDTMSDANASDPANALILTTQISPDGIAWQDFAREQWSGGTFVDKHTGLTVPNHLDSEYSIPAEVAGWRARAILELPQRLAVGFTVTVSPAP